jgi:hypothetical protein
MNLFLRILAIPFFLLLATSCVEDGLENTPTAEMYYVDLLYALHHQDQAGAKDASRKITKVIADLPLNNYPLRSENERDGMRYNMSNAQSTYMQVRASIEKNELEQAMIQLNRATKELEAARIPGFQDFYIARIHDFLSSWLEVSRTSEEEDITRREWRAINRRIKSAYARWRECRWIEPSPSLYYFSMEDSAAFTKAHGEVDRLVELLKASLSDDDEMLTKSYVDAVDSAVWSFVRRFGSPEEGGMKILPPEELDSLF